MKRVFLTVLSVTLCFASFAKHVSIETAQRVAVNFWKTQTVKTPVFEEISNTLGLDCMYFFVTSDNNGFVIVAADDAATPILGYSTSNGIFHTAELPDNLRGWLSHYTEEIKYAQKNNLEADQKTASEWQKLIAGVSPKSTKGAKAVEPLVGTQWDQDAPYNNKCPYDKYNGQSVRAVTGCVATAMAQVMKYWEWPIKGTGSKTYTCTSLSSQVSNRTVTANFDTLYYWDRMPAGGTITPTSNWNAQQKNAVALLMFHCGASVNMSYSFGGSAAIQSNAVNAFKNYFYYAKEATYNYKSSTSDNVWKTTLKNELDARRPMVYGGAASDGSDGHSFVCDGYDASENFHFNWGWSGSGDGYFALNSLNPGQGGIGSSGYNFTYYQDCITKIMPGIQTTTSFTLTNNSFAMGDRIAGACSFRNVSQKPFNGYLGIGVYDEYDILVAVISQTGSTTVNANATKDLSISHIVDYPLAPGSYTAKAICSVDGENWVPIVIGYNNCPTEQFIMITSGHNGINDIDATRGHVFAQGRNIVIDDARNMPVSVVDMMGRVVYSSKATSENVSISLPKSGIYLVKIGNEPAQKIMVR